MDSNWFEKPWADYVPAIILFIFVFFYFISQTLLIECNFINCDPVIPSYVFTRAPEPVDPSGALIREKDESGKESAASSQTAMAKRYRDRFIWIFFTMAQIFFCFLAILFFCTTIKSSLRNPRNTFLLLGLAFLLAITPAWWDEMPLIVPFIKNTIEISKGGVSSVLYIFRSVNTVNYATILGAVFASCVILRKKDDDENAGTSQKIASLSHKLDQLRAILYINTILLVVGALRITVLNNWSLVFISPDSTPAATIFLTGMAAILGGFYTLLLAGIFLPAAYVLHLRAAALLKGSGFFPAAQKVKLKEAGFSLSVGDSLPRLAAIIAPALAGQLAELLSVAFTR